MAPPSCGFTSWTGQQPTMSTPSLCPFPIQRESAVVGGGAVRPCGIPPVAGASESWSSVPATPSAPAASTSVAAIAALTLVTAKRHEFSMRRHDETRLTTVYWSQLCTHGDGGVDAVVSSVGDMQRCACFGSRARDG
jgi:hypothetical protein